MQNRRNHGSCFTRRTTLINGCGFGKWRYLTQMFRSLFRDFTLLIVVNCIVHSVEGPEQNGTMGYGIIS